MNFETTITDELIDTQLEYKLYYQGERVDVISKRLLKSHVTGKHIKVTAKTKIQGEI